MENLQGMRPLGKPRCIRDDNIKKNLEETKREGVEWIHLAHDRDHWWALANNVLHVLLVGWSVG
jgi:hypothetical protein